MALALNLTKPLQTATKSKRHSRIPGQIVCLGCQAGGRPHKKKPNIKFGSEQSRIIWATNRLVRKGLVNPHCSTADATRRSEQQNEPTGKDNQKTEYDGRVVDAKM